jgi:hypothetical protein
MVVGDQNRQFLSRIRILHLVPKSMFEFSLVPLCVPYRMVIFTSICLHVLITSHMFAQRLDKSRIRILNRIENFLKNHIRIWIWNQTCSTVTAVTFCKSTQSFSVYSICYQCCGLGIQDPGDFLNPGAGMEKT